VVFTDGSAALIAAAERSDRVRAAVSRDGRPDLAVPALPRVVAPTLLIVGGEARLETVQGVGHRVEEPRALERIAALKRDWFLAHLSATG